MKNKPELTYEEFCQLPLTYTMGMIGEKNAQRMYRNEMCGVQKEVFTKRKIPGEIYSGWCEGELYFYLDGDERQFRTVDQVYVAYMENVCGVKS